MTTSRRAVGPSHRRRPAACSPRTASPLTSTHDTVTCPNGVTVSIRRGADGGGIAYFAEHCTNCPLRAQCTNATGGRTHQRQTARSRARPARARQADPDWRADYRATRPKVERKLGHLMRRRHGGRRARVRGRPKVDADFNLLAAAANLARLAVARPAFHPDRMGSHRMTDAGCSADPALHRRRSRHDHPHPRAAT